MSNQYIRNQTEFNNDHAICTDHALCPFGGNPLLGPLSVTVHFVRGDVLLLSTLPSKQSRRRDDSAPAGRFHYLKSLSLHFRTQSTDVIIIIITLKLGNKLFWELCLTKGSFDILFVLKIQAVHSSETPVMSHNIHGNLRRKPSIRYTHISFNFFPSIHPFFTICLSVRTSLQVQTAEWW